MTLSLLALLVVLYLAGFLVGASRLRRVSLAKPSGCGGRGGRHRFRRAVLWLRRAPAPRSLRRRGVELVGVAMSEESRQTVRHAGAVVVQRMLVVAVGFLFAAVVPRAMGPQAYGQFSLIESMSLWFSMFSGLGAVSMMTRFVPEFMTKGDHAGLRRLASGLLALRIASGVLGSAAYLGLAAIWLRDVNRIAIGLVAIGVALTSGVQSAVHALSRPQSGRSLGNGRRPAPRLDAAVGVRGLSDGRARGAAAGAAGGVRSAVDWLMVEPRVSRVGFPAHRSQVPRTVSALQHRLFRGQRADPLVSAGSDRQPSSSYPADYAETAYYTLAFQAYLAVTSAAWRLLSAFGPLLSSLHTRGNFDQLKTWVERLLKLFSVATVLGCAVTVTFTGPIVRLILGPGYEPVTRLLPVLALATHWYGLGGVARLLAVTYGEPRASISSAAIQLVTFLAASSLLVPAMGSFGACLGIVVASGLFAVFGTWQMRRHVPYSLRTWMLVSLLGVAWLRSCWFGRRLRPSGRRYLTRFSSAH